MTNYECPVLKALNNFNDLIDIKLLTLKLLFIHIRASACNAVRWEHRDRKPMPAMVKIYKNAKTITS